MNKFSSYEISKLLEKSRTQKKRGKRNHEVLYFHKVDDPSI